jgi:hypothetical protein
LQNSYPRKVSSKINLNLRGTQKDNLPPQADDNEDQHVLIVGDSEESVNKAQYFIEKVLFSEPEIRNKIKEEQLKASQEIRSEVYTCKSF